MCRPFWGLSYDKPNGNVEVKGFRRPDVATVKAGSRKYTRRPGHYRDIGPFTIRA